MAVQTAQLEIQQLIQQEIECANMLLQSLELEYKYLKERQVDALEKVVREKHERILQLEQTSRQREKLINHLNTVAGNTVHPGQPYTINGDEQFRVLWNELVDIAEKCRDRNRVNGRVVELASKQARNTMDILHGLLPGSQSVSELYDHSGKATKSVDKRSLVQI